MHSLGQFSNHSKCMCIIHWTWNFMLQSLRMVLLWWKYMPRFTEDYVHSMYLGWLRKFYESFCLSTLFLPNIYFLFYSEMIFKDSDFFFPSGTQPCRHWLEKTMEETCICLWRINAALIVWFSALLTLFQCPSSALCNSWGIITFKPQSKIWEL